MWPLKVTESSCVLSQQNKFHVWLLKNSNFKVLEMLLFFSFFQYYVSFFECFNSVHALKCLWWSSQINLIEFSFIFHMISMFDCWKVIQFIRSWCYDCQLIFFDFSSSFQWTIYKEDLGNLLDEMRRILHYSNLSRT